MALEKSFTNLPLQLTSFIGRERDVDRVEELLAKTRLLTLTGSGGAGKTRLALQVGGGLLPGAAARSEPTFPDGIWLVELAPLADPALVPQTVASVFGLQGTDQSQLIEVLTNHLRTKDSLL